MSWHWWLPAVALVCYAITIGFFLHMWHRLKQEWRNREQE